MSSLRDLPFIMELHLREVELECFNTNSLDKVRSYYAESKKLFNEGYDSRHHISAAYGLIKKLEGKL